MKIHPSYYAIIPADVRYDSELSSTAKLFYGEITALASSQGICFAGNSYFAELYSISEKQVRRIIAQLEKKGYISVSRHAKSREIYVGIFPFEEGHFCPTRGTFLSNMGDKNVPHNNINNNINNNSASADENCIKLPLKNGTDFVVTDEVIKKYSELYPGISVTTEFKKMREWLNNNPQNRKVLIGRFISNWLSRVSKPSIQQTIKYSAAEENDEDFEKRRAMLENGY